jgi:beta-lactamase regulating signal transducer with metallopeptidase domain
MNELFDAIPSVLLRTTICLTLSALIVRGIMWAVQPRSPLVHRLAWSFVLLQGLLVSQWSFDISWYEAASSSQGGAAGHAEEFIGALPDFATPVDGIALETDRNAGLFATVDAATLGDPQAGFSLTQIFSFIWFGGVLIALCCTTGSYLLFQRRARTAHVARKEWQQQWQRLLDEEGINASIRLRVHQELGPLLCRLPSGYCVIVPQRIWSNFSAPQRLAVLRHELAHYQRGDVWKSFVARVLALPHWFNPCAWWAVRKFEETGEWACDQRIADTDPRQIPDFARALLSIVEPHSRNVCASAARGARVSVRLRRLLSFQDQEDSLMKRCMVLLVLLGLGTAGLIRFNLVAQESDEPSSPQELAESANDEARIDAFASQLDTEHSELLADLKAVAATRAGRIVIQDRASYHAEQLRDSARTEAIPGYLAEHFVRQGDVLTLKAGQSDYRTEFLNDVVIFNADIALIKLEMQSIASQMATDSDIEKLTARFLAHDSAPAIIYVEQLRKRLHPDEYVVQEALGRFMVADSAGKFVIRAGKRPEAERFAAKGLRTIKAMKRVARELMVFAEDLSTPDALHRDLKKAMASPSFTAFIASEIMENDDDGHIGDRFERMFDQLDHIFVETGDGLKINDEQRGELEELFAHYKSLRGTAEQLATPAKSFAANIRPGKELEDAWRKLLQSELIHMILAKEIGGASVNAEDIIQEILGEFLQRGDDNKFHITRDNTEELEGFIQEAFRMYRAVQRRGRSFDDEAEGMEDAELRRAFSTVGGRFVVMQSILQTLRAEQFDGLKIWIDITFESTDNGLSLRDGAEEVIREILIDVKNVQKELANDDF